jgi:hypothetical protein
MARKRALTPEKFYMDMQDIQDKPTELQIPGSSLRRPSVAKAMKGYGWQGASLKLRGKVLHRYSGWTR